MFFRRRTPEPKVTRVRFVRLYRASHGDDAAYGRTPEEAVARWKRHHKAREFSVWDIPGTIAAAILID
jgi:hypothetical protein